MHMYAFYSASGPLSFMSCYSIIRDLLLVMITEVSATSAPEVAICMRL